MQTLSIHDTKEMAGAITTCVKSLRQGEVIVYPTDTVYGLGADATNKRAVDQVRTIKGRDREKPILAIVSDNTMLARYAVLTPLAQALVDEFLPGPLTLVLTTHSTLLSPIMNTDGSAGFRIPDNSFCRDLVYSFGAPITSTSVNHSGMKQPQTLPAMLQQVKEHAEIIQAVVDVGILPQQKPSTIVDARGTRARVIREGVLPLSLLRRFL